MNSVKIQNKLEKYGLDGILLMSEENMRYASYFYITDGAVLVTREKAIMFTDSRYIEAATAQAKGVEVRLFGAGGLYAALKDEIAAQGLKSLGAEEGKLPHGTWIAFEELFGLKLKNATALMLELRAVKEQYEIDCLVKAQRISESALEEVLKFIKPGVSERDVAAELEYRMRLLGGDGISFETICVAGAKSSMPHGVPGNEKIKMGDFVTMDFGCLCDGYHSDMTRTVAVGYATDEMKKVYNTVLQAQLAGIAVARPGATGAEVHNAASKIITDAGYGQYFGHGFGHSVGLEIHEAPNANPRNNEPLPEGAVITAEPGIYLPGQFGVRIEDMVWLQGDSCVNLTKAPKELIIL